MKIKTYAINGLSEWHGDIKAGTLTVRVSFTGGTASPSGAVPAYFMTKDPVVQFVIENSKEFKNGFIRLEMQQTIAGEHPRMAIPKQKGATMGTVTEQQNVANPQSEVVNIPDGNDAGSLQTIRVADKSEAVEWLKEHFPEEGYTAVKLRTMAAVNEAGKKHGVVFELA